MITFPNAKINLGLYVVERRPDGYHNLETLFYPVQLTDILEVLPASQYAFHTSGLNMACEPGENLVEKAYHLLQQACDLPPVRIHLHKVIPPGAGLGGGSSDAAFMLKMLNSLFHKGIPDDQLEKFAGMLGADCPFFIANKPVLASGTGDRMTPAEIDLSAFKLILVKPPFSVNTAEAYRAIRPSKPQIRLTEIISQPVSTWKNRLVNDFEKTVFTIFPEIGRIKKELYRLGAVYASMTGSGSAVFGLFDQLPDNWQTAFSPSCFTFHT